MNNKSNETKPMGNNSSETNFPGSKPKKVIKKKSRLPKWARIILKILRVILVPVLCVMAILGGMIIGYVYIGEQEMSDVFKIDTWRHLYDLVFKDNAEG